MVNRLMTIVDFENRFSKADDFEELVLITDGFIGVEWFWEVNWELKLRFWFWRAILDLLTKTWNRDFDDGWIDDFEFDIDYWFCVK